MSHKQGSLTLWRMTAAALVACAATASTVNAAEGPENGKLSTTAALTGLIKRLSDRGALSPEDSNDLLLLVEADEAEAKAQAAQMEAALARAAAAEARARAFAALANRSASGLPSAKEMLEERLASAPKAKAKVAAKKEINVTPAPEDVETAPSETVAEAPAPAPRVVPQVTETPVDRLTSSRSSTPRVSPEALEDKPSKRVKAQAPAPAVSTEETQETEPVAAVPVAPKKARAALREVPAPAPAVDEDVAEASAKPAPAHAKAKPAAVQAEEHEEAAAETVSEGDDEAMHVTYVPDVVKEQLREEVKQEVLEDARREGWATPRAVPEWLSRFRFFGDVRFRYEGMRFPAGNALGSLTNFNAINTGNPYDVGIRNTVPAPKLNVDADRQRLRLRARLGIAIDLGDGLSSGLRFATGESNSPVTQNQSLGAAGNGQGGNFSKYAVWIDRAFLRYETGGLPDEDFVTSAGRFDNPFMSTSMLWADDLGFDGMEAHGRYGLGDSVTSFFALGAFPVFNTDLNLSSINSSKFKSTDKWLYGTQLGASVDITEKITAKLGIAYYQFTNVQGKLSTEFVPFTVADAGDTDGLRPAFAQKGNTYMPLRNIKPVDGAPSAGGNDGGQSLQFQYFGLASAFKPLVADARVEFNHFAPFQVVLNAEYIKNLGFDSTEIGKLAINNTGVAATSGGLAPFLGKGTAWLASVTVGQAALQKRWDWNLALGYRKVGSDAVIDGFADSDFGGGGTNVKGFTVSTSLALSPRVSLGFRWFSASQVSGDVFKNDIFQMDLNGKF